MNMIEHVRDCTSLHYNAAGDCVKVTDYGTSVRLVSHLGTIKTRDIDYVNRWLSDFGTAHRIERGS